VIRVGVKVDLTRRLATEAVQSAALALESIDDIERGDGLALGVLFLVSAWLSIELVQHTSV
jgi:hypothetical protein